MLQVVVLAVTGLVAIAFSLVAVLVATAQNRNQTTVPPRVEPEYLMGPRSQPLPFSDAVRVGDLLILSGELGTDPGTLSLAPGGIREEARQALDNVKAKLLRHGSTMNRVVKVTVMLADMNDWGAFNEVYLSYFEPARLPARSAFGASGLALGARVELEVWAAA